MLLGRESELVELDRLLGAIQEGAAGWLRVSGEPGIGKSALLACLVERANDEHLTVLSGRASEFEHDVAFGLVADALHPYVRAHGAVSIEALVPDEQELLGRVLPALAPSASATTLVPAERYRIHRSIHRLLAEIVSIAPAVLVFDDIHWADAATNELIVHLMHATPIVGLLVVTADRPTQLDPDVRAALERGSLDGIVTRMDVGPLEAGDAERLVRDRMGAHRPIDDGGVAAAVGAAGGNPLYLRALADRGSPSAGATSGGRDIGTVPQELLAIIGRELDNLPPAERLLAQGGAVAGDPFDVRDAVIAAALELDETLALVDGLVAAGVVVPAPEGRFGFRHPIVRQATYEAIGPGWRIRAHARLADALRASDAPAVEIAHHLAMTAQRGDVGAVDVFAAAGDDVVVAAPAIAAERYGDALRVLPASADPGVRATILGKQAEALQAAGRLQESRDAFKAAISQLRGGDPVELVRLSAACGSVEHLLGLADDAHDTLRDALGSVADPSSAPAAATLAELALNAAFYRSDFADLDQYSERALEVAQVAADHGTEAMALALRSFAAFNVGRFDDASTALDTAARLIDDLPDRELTDRLGALSLVARAEFYLDRDADGLRHAERGIKLCRTSGRTQYLLTFRGIRGSFLSVIGRGHDARAESRDLIDAARLTGVDRTIMEALIELSWLEIRVGDLDAGLAACEEAASISARLPRTYLATAINWSKAEAHLEKGEPEQVLEVLLRPIDGSKMEDAVMPGPLLPWHVLAQAEASLGRVAEAKAWLKKIDGALPLVAGLAMPVVWQRRASGAILLAEGKALEAAHHFEQSAARADVAGLVHEGSVSRRRAGLALAAAGERDDAIAVLDQARREFERYGAARLRDATTQDLRRLGVRIGRGGRRVGTDDGAVAGIGALSDREREIADLVAAGRTNKEIGETLFISSRTVERHLSHVFDKLGVDSRSQLGALIERSRV